MATGPSVSFTRAFSGIASGLYSECMVADRRAPVEGSTNLKREFFPALWDTGSTGCMVSRRVVDACNLQEEGQGPISNVSGTVEDVPRYMVNLYLPNGLVVKELSVALGELVDFDILIGMDVITLGDLAVTNADGQTTFTFRVPSRGGIDFTAEPQSAEPA